MFCSLGAIVGMILGFEVFHIFLDFQEDIQVCLHPPGGGSRLVCGGEKACICFDLVQLCLRPLPLEQVENNDA